MKTKLLLLLTLTFVFYTGCSHIVRRKGYQISSEKVSVECSPVFCKNAEIDTACDTVIGKVKLRDSGFSTRCSEADAIAILKKECCASGAEVINVIDEERPDFSSTCYRVTAQLIKKKSCNDHVPGEEVIGGNYEFPVDSLSVVERVHEDRIRKRLLRLIEIGVVSGLFAALFVNVLY